MTDVSIPPTSVTITDLQGKVARVRRENVVRGVVFVAALWSVLISALILLSLFREAWTFITQVVVLPRPGPSSGYPPARATEATSIAPSTIPTLTRTLSLIVGSPFEGTRRLSVCGHNHSTVPCFLPAQ